ncbi:MAG: DNA/RNA non-specific endonuclease [Bilifractor sp.]
MEKDYMVESNGYSFEHYSNGTVVADGDLQNERAGRNQRAQAKAGGALRQASDEGGHLIAARFNGPPIHENLSAQDHDVNHDCFGQLEKSENEILQNGGHIHTERVAYSSEVNANGDCRPENYMINDHITQPDGTSFEVHESFTNLPASEMESLEDAAEQIEMPGTANTMDTFDGGISESDYQEISDYMENLSLSDF